MNDHTEKISKSNSFIDKFDALLYKARKDLSTIELDNLTMAACDATQDLRKFKLNG